MAAFTHVTVGTNDLAKARAFYGGLLGYPEMVAGAAHRERDRARARRRRADEDARRHRPRTRAAPVRDADIRPVVPPSGTEVTVGDGGHRWGRRCGNYCSRS